MEVKCRDGNWIVHDGKGTFIRNATDTEVAMKRELEREREKRVEDRSTWKQNGREAFAKRVARAAELDADGPDGVIEALQALEHRNSDLLELAYMNRPHEMDLEGLDGVEAIKCVFEAWAELVEDLEDRLDDLHVEVRVDREDEGIREAMERTLREAMAEHAPGDDPEGGERAMIFHPPLYDPDVQTRGKDGDPEVRVWRAISDMVTKHAPPGLEPEKVDGETLLEWADKVLARMAEMFKRRLGPDHVGDEIDQTITELPMGPVVRDLLEMLRERWALDNRPELQWTLERAVEAVDSSLQDFNDAMRSGATSEELQALAVHLAMDVFALFEMCQHDGGPRGRLRGPERIKTTLVELARGVYSSSPEDAKKLAEIKRVVHKVAENVRLHKEKAEQWWEMRYRSEQEARDAHGTVLEALTEAEEKLQEAVETAEPECMDRAHGHLETAHSAIQ